MSNRRAPDETSPVVDLAWFRRLDVDNPLEIIVQASIMRHEIALRDYFKLWSTAGGETILEETFAENDPDRASQLLSKGFSDGQTWVTRRTGFKVWQGIHAWVVTLNVACPAGRLEPNAALMQQIAASFAPLESIDYSHAEHLKLVTRGQPVDFASYLPMSWRELPHRHDLPGPMRHAWLKKLRDHTSGTFSIVAASKEDFPASAIFLKEAISTWDTLGVDPRQVNFDPPGKTGSWQTVRGTQDVSFPREGGNVDYRLEMLLADTGSHWFHAEVFGPAPEQDFEAWAINHRALDLFARNLKTA